MFLCDVHLVLIFVFLSIFPLLRQCMGPTTRLWLRSSVYVRTVKGVWGLLKLFCSKAQNNIDFGVKYFTCPKVVKMVTWIRKLETVLIVWNSEPWDLECWKLGFAIQTLHHSILKKNTKRGLKSCGLTVTWQYLCKIPAHYVFLSSMCFFNSLSPISENNVFCWNGCWIGKSIHCSILIQDLRDMWNMFYWSIGIHRSESNWGDNVSARKALWEVKREPGFYCWPHQRPLDEIEFDCICWSLQWSIMVVHSVNSITRPRRPTTYLRSKWYSAPAGPWQQKGAYVQGFEGSYRRFQVRIFCF